VGWVTIKGRVLLHNASRNFQMLLAWYSTEYGLRSPEECGLPDR